MAAIGSQTTVHRHDDSHHAPLVPTAIHSLPA